MHLTSLEVLILLIGRPESYSCKMIGEEKAQYKRFNRDVVPGVNDMEVLSPPQTLSEFADDLCFHRQARFVKEAYEPVIFYAHQSSRTFSKELYRQKKCS
ncbi:hypothetical protein Avbf_15951 [Armadillidium vulgare]|nr:hypothetical protein Avbf_15951 [Armadillidium vulgare]